MNKTLQVPWLFFECPLCKALNLSQTSASIQFIPSRTTYILTPHHTSLTAPTRLPRGCVSGSHFISIYTLHTFSGPSYLNGDQIVSASCAICWELVHRHCKQWACRDDSTVISVGRPAIVLSMLMDTVKGENWLQALTARGFLVWVICFISLSAGGGKKKQKNNNTKKTTYLICKYNFRLT